MSNLPLLLLVILTYVVTSQAYVNSGSPNTPGPTTPGQTTGGGTSGSGGSGSGSGNPGSGNNNNGKGNAKGGIKKLLKKIWKERKRIDFLENCTAEIIKCLDDLKIRVQKLENLTGCPPGFPVQFGRSCYAVSNTAFTFAEAVQNCSARGGKLVEIETSAENEFLKAIAVANPVQTCESKADVVFLLDESGSIGQGNFNIIKTFVIDVINTLDIGLDAVRVGLATFSSSVTLEFHLDKYGSASQMATHITNIVYNGGVTSLGAALNYARNTMFTAGCGDRAGVPNVIIVLTDGVATDSISGPAAAVHAAGIKAIALGIGSGVSTSQLNEIATDPDSDHVFLVSGFNALNDTVDALGATVCSFTGYWIGATDQASEGSFVRPSDNVAIGFTDWLSGQPDDNNGNEDCTEICTNDGNTGQWNDVNCAQTNKFFCEYERCCG